MNAKASPVTEASNFRASPSDAIWRLISSALACRNCGLSDCDGATARSDLFTKAGCDAADTMRVMPGGTGECRLRRDPFSGSSGEGVPRSKSLAAGQSGSRPYKESSARTGHSQRGCTGEVKSRATRPDRERCRTPDDIVASRRRLDWHFCSRAIVLSDHITHS